MKGFRVSKIIKEINFGGIWDKLEAKNVPRDKDPQNIWD